MERTYIDESTLKVGDRVKHWSGVTGTVVEINHHNFVRDSRHAEEECWVGTDTIVLVQEDKRPRQRKLYPPVQWDGIVEVLTNF